MAKRKYFSTVEYILSLSVLVYTLLVFSVLPVLMGTPSLVGYLERLLSIQ